MIDVYGDATGGLMSIQDFMDCYQPGSLVAFGGLYQTEPSIIMSIDLEHYSLAINVLEGDRVRMYYTIRRGFHGCPETYGSHVVEDAFENYDDWSSSINAGGPWNTTDGRPRYMIRLIQSIQRCV